MAAELKQECMSNYKNFYRAVGDEDLKGIQEWSVFSEQGISAQTGSLIAMGKSLPADQKKEVLARLESMGIKGFDELRDPTKAFRAVVKPAVLTEYPDPATCEWVSLRKESPPDSASYAALIGKFDHKAYAVLFVQVAGRWKVVGIKSHGSDGDTSHNLSDHYQSPSALTTALLEELRNLQ